MMCPPNGHGRVLGAGQYDHKPNKSHTNIMTQKQSPVFTPKPSILRILVPLALLFVAGCATEGTYSDADLWPYSAVATNDVPVQSVDTDIIEGEHP